jgi:hypothetical protein
MLLAAFTSAWPAKPQAVHRKTAWLVRPEGLGLHAAILMTARAYAEVWPIPGWRNQMTETSATRTETNRGIIRRAFDAWR